LTSPLGKKKTNRKKGENGLDCQEKEGRGPELASRPARTWAGFYLELEDAGLKVVFFSLT